MFRVYIEGKSPKELVANTKAWLDMIEPTQVSVTSKVEIPKEIEVDEPEIDFPETVQADTMYENLVAKANPSSDRDARGWPWDERIHSASKATNKDGSWRIRRGADEKVVKQIESQYLGQTTQPAPVVEQPAPQATVIPFTPPAPVVAQPVAAPSYDPIPIPQNVPTKPAHSYDTFKANFITTMAGLIGAKELTQEYIQSLNQYFGVAQIMDVRLDDVKCRQLFDALVQGGKITQVG